MSRDDDYLWDRSDAGAADRSAEVGEVERLERLLSRFAHTPDELPPERRRGPRAAWRHWPISVLVAAAMLVVAFVLWPDDDLRPGAARRTYIADRDSVTVRLGGLATLTLEPGSELRFDFWRADEARFSLLRGALAAQVARSPAVPRRFLVVETPLGRVIDEGCRFTVRIAANGRETVEVTEGAVSYVFAGRTVYVPAGARTDVTRKGPSTPLFGDASPSLRAVTRKFESMSAESPFRPEGAREIVRMCRRPSDALVLWHLLRDPDPQVREIAERALLDRFGPPVSGPNETRTSFEPDEWLLLLHREAFPGGG